MLFNPLVRLKKYRTIIFSFVNRGLCWRENRAKLKVREKWKINNKAGFNILFFTIYLRR